MRKMIYDDRANSIFSIGGSVFIALALIVIFGVIIGVLFNQVIPGLGDLALWFAGIAFVILIIIAIAVIISRLY